MKIIKLMPDHYSWPLWVVEGMEYDNLNPANLPLLPATVKRLDEWADVFTNMLNLDDPANSDFKSPQEEIWFKQEGTMLWQQVQTELAREYLVYYYDIFFGHLFKTYKEYEYWLAHEQIPSQEFLIEMDHLRKIFSNCEKKK